MSDDIRAGVDFSGDFNDFIRAVDRADRAARAFDDTLDRLERRASAGSLFNFDVDEGNLDNIIRSVNDLDGTADLRVNVRGEELDTAVRQAQELDNNRTMDVNVVGDDFTNLVQLLSAGAAAVTITASVTGTAVSFFEGLSEFSGVPGLIETHNALLNLEATTGRIIPDAEHLINDLYVDAWGESREELGQVVAFAVQLGISNENLAGAIESAFNASTTGAGEVNEILRAQQQLVRQGLVGSYEEAADLIVVAVQNGANQADDLLDTIIEYTPDFEDFDLTGQQVASVLAGGIEAGFMNTDLIGDALREHYIRLTTDLRDNEELQQAFQDIDYFDEAQLFVQGELAGDEYLSGLVDAINNIPDQATRDYLAGLLFGSPVEDLGARGIQAFDPFTNYLETEYPGAAERAGNLANQNIQTAITQLRRTAEVGIGQYLNEQLDITGFLDESTVAIQGFLSDLTAGESLSVAFRANFDDTRLGDIIVRLQEVLSDFLLSFLEGVRAVVAAIPGASTGGIDRAIEELAQAELTIDLDVAETASDLSDAVEDALNRGISADEIFSQLSQQAEDALAAGDLEQAFAIGSFSEGLVEAQNALQEMGLTIEQLQAISDPVAAGDSLQGIGQRIMDQLNAEDIVADPATLEQFGEQIGVFLSDPELYDVDLSEIIDTSEIDSAIDPLVQAFDDALAAADFEAAIPLAQQLEDITGEDYFADLENAANLLDIDLEPLIEQQQALGETGGDAAEGMGEIGDAAGELPDDIAPVVRTTDELVTNLDTIGIDGVRSIETLRNSIIGIGNLSETEIGALTTQAENAHGALLALEDLNININVNLTGEGARFVTGAQAEAGGGSAAIQEDMTSGVP